MQNSPAAICCPPQHLEPTTTTTAWNEMNAGSVHLIRTYGTDNGTEFDGPFHENLVSRGIRAFEVSEAAEQAWVDRILASSVDGGAFAEGCTPSRFNFEGNPEKGNPQNGSFGGGAGDIFGYRSLLADWRARGDFAGFELQLETP